MTQTSVAVGFFDGLHIGHRAVIDAAVSAGLPAVVCTFPLTDPPAGHDAPWLLLPEARRTLLQSWGVSRVAEWGFREIGALSPEAFFDRLCAELNPRVICCGFNYRFGKNAAGNENVLRALCERRGIELRVVQPVLLDGSPVSSTRVRTLLTEGRPEEAARCLERPFSFSLPVTDGRRLGRTLKFPTVNQPFPDMFIRPRFGVYVSNVRLPDGSVRRGVTNIGVKPTVGSDSVLAETHILDYAADLYGRTLKVELLSFLRPEQKFESLDALRAAIAEAAEQARNFRVQA